MIPTITLNPCIDHLVTVRRLVHDDAIRPVSEGRRAGGKGVNVSRILHALGVDTRAHLFAGGWTGEELVRLVEGEGIPVSRYNGKNPTRVNFAVTDLSTGKQLRFLGAGSRAGGSELTRISAAILKNRRKIFCCAMSGSLPPGLGKGTYGTLIRRFQAGGIRCVLDTDGVALTEGVKALPFCIKPNEFEMARLSGSAITSDKKLVHAALRFVDDGIHHVVVSLEGRGALFVPRGEAPFWARPPRVRVKSRVGAGDTLLAGFLAGLSRGNAPREAARLATAAASAWVMLAPGERFVPSRVPALAKKVLIEQAKY